MDYIEEEIGKITNAFSAAPYLFIGSGFSRRYINLPDWEGLLKEFCTDIRDFAYYKSSSNGNLPKAAAKMATDFNEMIWDESKDEYKEFRELNKENFYNDSSALKIAISNYIGKIGIADVNADYKEEIKNLQKMNIEGIITTNWDNLLSEIFPEYHRIIGQNELIYSNPYGIGEIFKIHGCASSPESLVLTDLDYENFNERNAYLAAKLVTYFIEHPVVFLGYSLSDENINLILKSIVNCLGEKEINKLSHNFIFLQRAKGEEKIIKSVKDIHGISIPITTIIIDDFSKLYRPLSKVKRKLPLRLLRYFKEQLFEFVHTNEPTEKVAVIDIDSQTLLEDIEFAIGIGIHDKLGHTGYDRIRAGHIIEDILFDNQNYDPQAILDKVLPEIKGFVPIYKYLSKDNRYDASNLKKNALKAVERNNLNHFRTNAYQKQFDKNWKDKPVKELYSLTEYDKALRMLVFHEFKTDKQIKDFGNYLKQIFPSYFDNGKIVGSFAPTFFRKAVCLYDFLVDGNYDELTD
ncbi:MAG: hypothetical protein ACI8ZM_004170 [Crocinitomix sp.]|jgi:hypothetical protein